MSKYVDVADQMRSAIEHGEHARGSVLPSEERLAEQFDVSRPVINRALRLLRAEGLIRVERGRGTVVHEIAPILRNSTARHLPARREHGASRGAFDAEVRALGHEPRSILMEVGPVTPPAAVAQMLEFTVDEVAAIRRRHMYADDTPVQIASSYVPWSIAAGTPITQHDTGPGGIYSRLADLGYPVRRFLERITVRMPEPDEAQILQASSDQPVFVINRIAWTDASASERPVEVTAHVMPVHQWQLDYEWQVDT